MKPLRELLKTERPMFTPEEEQRLMQFIANAEKKHDALPDGAYSVEDVAEIQDSALSADDRP
jgi:hypothetical protein